MARIRLEDGVKPHRVTLDLRPDLYERLRTLAFKRRDSMNIICHELMDRFLVTLEAEAGIAPQEPTTPLTESETEQVNALIYDHAPKKPPIVQEGEANERTDTDRSE